MNNLYRIEKVMHLSKELGGPDLPGTDDVAMLTNNSGVAFVKLHPVRVAAKRAAPCWVCDKFTAPARITLHTPSGQVVTSATNCPLCGRPLKKEGQP